MTKKRILILGSTGSIGTQVLECLAQLRDVYEVVGLTCNSSEELFEAQKKEWSPRYSLVAQNEKNPDQVLCEIVQKNDVDVVVNALSGVAGVEPMCRAVEAGKAILFANKESFVMRGEWITKRAQETGAQLIPLDSELAGLWRLLKKNGSVGENLKRVKNLIITASGGPFFGYSKEQLAGVSLSNALKHPTWSMGKKITIDSATLMNKAFELIECARFFNFPAARIKVFVQRQSLIHAGVEYVDGQVEWVMYPPSMKFPIFDALTCAADVVLPNGYAPRNVPEVDLLKTNLSFAAVDEAVFPALSFARKALSEGEDMCASLCQKNEVAVARFLKGEIDFVTLLNLA